MANFIYTAEQVVPASLNETFDFFSKAENLQKITPPLLNFHITTPLPIAMQKGTIIDYKLKIHGFPIKWKTLIELWEPGVRFIDFQVKGPYKLWRHLHEFKDLKNGTTLMNDRVEYALPFGPLGLLVHPILVRPDIEKIFAYRKQVIDKTFGKV